jgi:hypothetical protein
MQQTRRPVLFVLLGLLVCIAAGFLIYDHKQPSSAPGPQKFTYKINQSATAAAHYTQSKFFDASGSPGGDNTAYIASLTDYLKTQFYYRFTGSRITDLRYSYKADAVVHSKFSGKESADNAANVWTKKYTLLPTVSGSIKTNMLTFGNDVRIPFAEYAAEAHRFRNAYNVPVSSEVVVTYTVSVTGKENGVPFANAQTTTVIAPLEQQLYKIAVKFNKTDSKEVVAKQSLHVQNIVSTYEIPVAVALLLLGLGLVLYGFRKQIIKPPYQRELARIYRYYDGIIVKARKPVSLKNIKTIVELDSFDDLLNIEEDTGSPIVANELSGIATRFIITSENTAYVFTLGRVTPLDELDYVEEDDPMPAKPTAK